MAARLGDADSAIIIVARCICIYFMMYVHVNPGPSEPSFVSDPERRWLAWLTIDFLGRASVATLSVVSGYLAAAKLARGDGAAFVRSRFAVLVVPMIAWNAIALLAALSAARLGIETSALSRIAGGGLMESINALAGVTGPTFQTSLFFLRDLFVASALLALAAPLWLRRPLASLAVVFAVTLTDAVAPLIFRPSILLFMLLGAVLRLRGFALSRFAAPALVVSVAAPALAAYAVLALFGPGAGVAFEAQNLLMRTALVAMSLHAAAILAGSPAIGAFRRLEPAVYLGFLSHTLVIGVVWKGLLAAGLIDPRGPDYLVFFATAPALALAVAVGLRAALSKAPPAVSIVLRGKS